MFLHLHVAAIHLLFDHNASSPGTLSHAVKTETPPTMGLLAPWFALVLSFLTLCRTASVDLAPLERRPAVSDSLATFVLSQTNNSRAANPAQNQTVNSNLEEFEYDIPNTLRYVDIVIDKDKPLDPTSFHSVIETALSQLNSHIAVHGNGPLLPQDNPYLVISGNCCSATEADLKHDGTPWLTYQILLQTFIGLKVILDDERRYFSAGYSTASSRGMNFGQGAIAKVPQAVGADSMSIKTTK